MKILFVNACMRGDASRTLTLCEAFLSEIKKMIPESEVVIHDLRMMRLKSVDQAVLDMKEPLCDAYAWDHPLFAPVNEFQSADVVLIGAPYWDMSFPSVLKVWVENMYVRNLTFRYINDQPVGLCLGKEAVYITTAGSPIGDYDWGTGYIRDVMKVLGIPALSAVKAEALDLEGRDVAGILAEAEQCARKLAGELAQRLR